MILDVFRALTLHSVISSSRISNFYFTVSVFHLRIFYTNLYFCSGCWRYYENISSYDLETLYHWMNNSFLSAIQRGNFQIRCTSWIIWENVLNQRQAETMINKAKRSVWVRPTLNRPYTNKPDFAGILKLIPSIENFFAKFRWKIWLFRWQIET